MQDGLELKKIRKLDSEIESDSQLFCCRISPNLSQLAVCSNNGSLYLIEMKGILQGIMGDFS